MNKRLLHYYHRKMSRFSSWYFLIAAVMFFSVAAFALRQNNLQMIELKEAVFQADEAGEGIEEALRELRQHVHSHMNTDLVTGEDAIRPPIQLTHEFDRLRQAEQERVRDDNSSVYAEAERVCEERFGVGRLDRRVQCVESYVREQGVQHRPVPKELYQFDFASPRWSPDLAGWSLVAGSVALIVFVSRSLLEVWLKKKLEN